MLLATRIVDLFAGYFDASVMVIQVPVVGKD